MTLKKTALIANLFSISAQLLAIFLAKNPFVEFHIFLISVSLFAIYLLIRKK